MMYRALMSIFLCMAVFQVSAKGEYADLTNVEFSIVKNGEELHKGSMLLLDGKEATQTLYADSEQPSHRIIMNSGRKMFEGKEQVVLDFQYWSYDGGKWTTEVNSKIISYPNEEAVLSMGSKGNSLDISVTATTKDYEVLKRDDKAVNSGL